MAGDAQIPVSGVKLSGAIELRSSLEQERLNRAEAAISKLEKRKSVWEILQAIIPGVVLAIVGYFLNDSVNHAFQEKQLEYSNVKEMQSLIGDLEKATERSDALAKAAQLATFGRYAIPMLVSTLEVGNPNSQMGAEKALRLIGGSDATTVCKNVIPIIRNRSKLYSWQTHLRALALIGDLECTSALPAVTEYQDDLKKLDFMPWMNAPSEPKPVSDIKAQADFAASRLRARPRGWLQRWASAISQ